MTISRAINHFLWKFNPKNNQWKATERDQEAINTIIEFTEKKHSQDFVNQELFAKLYITFYGELLKFYDATVFDKTPQKALHKILDTPIETIIEKFVDKANLQEQTVEYRSKNKTLHPQEGHTETIEPFAEAMTVEDATENLTAMINLAINEYS